MEHSVCPWWMGYVLLNPLRRLGQSPRRILGPLLSPGMTVLDVGCAMGYFSIPMARMVGPMGRVICVDLEPRMLQALHRRAARAGVEKLIEARQCTSDSLEIDDLEGSVDVCLAFAVLHEVPDVASVLGQIARTLRPNGVLLLAEPKGHVKEQEFSRELQLAAEVGLAIVDRPPIARSITALLQRRPKGSR